MASEEIRKKWGTIYMGNREASLEQLNAMQEPLRREQEKKEQTQDYMERVRARAADRAREILGAAYAERQKVLEEAKREAALMKRKTAEECAALKAEGEALARQAQAGQAKAEETLEEAERIRSAAHEEGFQAGMDKAGAELHEFRAELGQSFAKVLRAIERERKNILENWREELAMLARAAAQAGTGLVLSEEREAVIRNLVFQALDLLENRSVITMRVNPEDEAQVSDMFRAARERAPELKQWIVTGDSAIEPGGLVAETMSGSVDLQRRNFREMIDGILGHLGLPDMATDAINNEMAELVEREVAHIAALTPELDEPVPEEPVQMEPAPEEQPLPPLEEQPFDESFIPGEETLEPEPELEADLNHVRETGLEGPGAEPETMQPAPEPRAEDPTLAELEDELFPLEGETMPDEASQPELESVPVEQPATPAAPVTPPPDPQTLAEGGFL